MPILPNYSSDTEPALDQPISHRTRTRNNDRVMRKQAKIQVNSVQFDCNDCAIYHARTGCQRHQNRYNILHCESCADVFHNHINCYKNNVMYSPGRLCQKCHDMFHSVKNFVCQICAAEVARIPVSAAIPINCDEIGICSFNVDHSSLSITKKEGSFKPCTISVYWECNECSKHMYKQQLYRDLITMDNKAKLHCDDCADKFHKAIYQLSTLTDIKTEDKTHWAADYLCQDCVPAQIFEGGIHYLDPEYIDTDQEHNVGKYQQYDYNPLNLSGRNGVTLSEELSEVDIELIIKYLKDNGVDHINQIRQSDTYPCHCNYCQVFSDFAPMVNLSCQIIMDKINAQLGCQMKPDVNRIVRCNVLWYYFIRYVRPSIGDHSVRRRNYAFYPQQLLNSFNVITEKKVISSPIISDVVKIVDKNISPVKKKKKKPAKKKNKKPQGLIDNSLGDLPKQNPMPVVQCFQRISPYSTFADVVKGQSLENNDHFPTSPMTSSNHNPNDRIILSQMNINNHMCKNMVTSRISLVSESPLHFQPSQVINQVVEGSQHCYPPLPSQMTSTNCIYDNMIKTQRVQCKYPPPLMEVDFRKIYPVCLPYTTLTKV